jgi:hypothetical protein
MDLVAEAPLSVDFDQMGDALGVIIDFVRNHCVPTPTSVVSLFLSETGFKSTRVLAETFPATHRAFTVGMYDPRRLRPGQELLAAANAAKLKDTCCNAQLTDFLPFDASISLLDRLRPEFPPSGRGMMIHVEIASLLARGAGDAVRVDVSFQRWRSGSKRKTASVRLSCPAESKRDVAAKRTLLAAAEVLGLKIGKPSLQAPSGRGEPTPAPALLLNAYQAFLTAFDQTTAVIDKSDITLDGIPLLMPRFEASARRIQDMLAGRREEIDLVARLKHMMRESRLGYEFDNADSELVSFVKPLTPHLEARLSFERYHNQGLGKSFTALVGVGFPQHRQLQVGPIAALFRDNLFRLFHRALDRPAWTYVTSDELAAALGGCLSLLNHTLPLMESQFTACLGQPVADIPRGMAIAGALSAKEAEAMSREVVLRWSDDAELRSVSFTTDSALRAFLGPALDGTGRLKPHGAWQISYGSAFRGACMVVSVRHTGAMRWECLSRVPRSVVGVAQVPIEFVDSTRLSDTVNAELQRLTDGTKLRVIDTLWTLGGLPGQDSEPVWTVHILLADPAGLERRDRYLTFSSITGTLTASADVPGPT